MDPLEEFWSNILSRSPKLVCKAYLRLDEASKSEVISHLNRMVTESGWHAEQAASAKAALDALSKIDTNIRHSK